MPSDRCDGSPRRLLGANLASTTPGMIPVTARGTAKNMSRAPMAEGTIGTQGEGTRELRRRGVGQTTLHGRAFPTHPKPSSYHLRASIQKRRATAAISNGATTTAYPRISRLSRAWILGLMPTPDQPTGSHPTPPCALSLYPLQSSLLASAARRSRSGFCGPSPRSHPP